MTKPKTTTKKPAKKRAARPTAAMKALHTDILVLLQRANEIHERIDYQSRDIGDLVKRANLADEKRLPERLFELEKRFERENNEIRRWLADMLGTREQRIESLSGRADCVDAPGTGLWDRMTYLEGRLNCHPLERQPFREFLRRLFVRIPVDPR